MSVNGMLWAFSVNGLRPVEKFVLVTLGKYANDENVAWPSQKVLTAITGIPRSTLQLALKRLEAQGWITVKPTWGKFKKMSNRYHLCLTGGPPNAQPVGLHEPPDWALDKGTSGKDQGDSKKQNLVWGNGIEKGKIAPLMVMGLPYSKELAIDEATTAWPDDMGTGLTIGQAFMEYSHVLKDAKKLTKPSDIISIAGKKFVVMDGLPPQLIAKPAEEPPLEISMPKPIGKATVDAILFDHKQKDPAQSAAEAITAAIGKGKGSGTGKQLSRLWRALHALYEPTVFVPEITHKQVGQLVQIGKKIGTQTPQVLKAVLEDWIGFAKYATKQAGMSKDLVPQKPQIGFLLLHVGSAVDFTSKGQFSLPQNPDVSGPQPKSEQLIAKMQDLAKEVEPPKLKFDKPASKEEVNKILEGVLHGEHDGIS